ncbi:MAG: hypothetical protein JWR34_3406 [Mycobacterium sp.]|nr:hypothetical protein [Mycobacterium sp.]
MSTKLNPIVYIEADAVGDEDRTKAVEAQGLVFIESIKSVMTSAKDRANIAEFLAGIATMLHVQSTPFGDDEDFAFYTDGTCVVALKPFPDINIPVPKFESMANEYEYLSEYIEALFGIAGFRVVVNPPPSNNYFIKGSDSPPPTGLMARLMKWDGE